MKTKDGGPTLPSIHTQWMERKRLCITGDAEPPPLSLSLSLSHSPLGPNHTHWLLEVGSFIPPLSLVVPFFHLPLPFVRQGNATKSRWKNGSPLEVPPDVHPVPSVGRWLVWEIPRGSNTT